MSGTRVVAVAFTATQLGGSGILTGDGLALGAADGLALPANGSGFPAYQAPADWASWVSRPLISRGRWAR